MGRLLLLLLIIATVVLLWKAFGPGSWRRPNSTADEPPRIKGPDDDEEFLWRLELEQFKKRRAEEERRKNTKKNDNTRDNKEG